MLTLHEARPDLGQRGGKQTWAWWGEDVHWHVKDMSGTQIPEEKVSEQSRDRLYYTSRTVNTFCLIWLKNVFQCTLTVDDGPTV